MSLKTDELLEKIKDAQKRHGSPLPVVMLTACCSGEVNDVVVVFDTITQRYELHLVERP